VFFLFIFRSFLSPFLLEAHITFHRVLSTLFTADARYVLSGSDEGNIRLWKARASEKLGIIGARERAAMEYRESLKQRWSVDNEVGRIARYVFIFIVIFLFFALFNHSRIFIDVVTSPNPSSKLLNSKRRCKTRVWSRKIGGASIRGLERTSPRRRGGRLLLRSRVRLQLDMDVVGNIHTVWYALCFLLVVHCMQYFNSHFSGQPFMTRISHSTEQKYDMFKI